MDEENKKEDLGSGLSKNKKYIIIGIVVIIILGFLANGFWERMSGEKMAENILEEQFGGEVDIDSDGDSISFKGNGGTFNAGEATNWPSNMPNSVPEFTAGELTMAASVSVDGNGWQVAASGVSKNDFNAYHSLLESKGWKNVGVFDSSVDMAQMSNENYNLFMVFDAEESNFSLTISEKKQ